MKNLRVRLNDLEGENLNGAVVSVGARYTHDLTLTDGQIIPAVLKVKQSDETGVVFSVFESDSELLAEGYQDFAIKVFAEIQETAPSGRVQIRHYRKTVKVFTTSEGDPIDLGTLPTAEPLPRQWLTVDEVLTAAGIGGTVETDWESITNKPLTFTPSAHQHAIGDVTGLQEALDTIETTPGADGASAYEVAVSNGFVGSTSQWLASLVGPQGAKGATGATGEPGPKGDQGPQGAPGPKGDQGIQGIKGDTGAQGPAGPAGMEWRGEYSPTTDYIDGDAVYYNGGSWFAAGDPTVGEAPSMESPNWNPLAIQGLQGPKGDTGEQGIQGIAGEQGIQGIQGETGPKGDTGATGTSVSNAIYSAGGPLEVAEGTHRFYVPTAGVLAMSNASLATPGSTDTVINVRKNDITAHVVTIPAGSNVATNTDPVALATGDYITVAVTTAGTDAADLTVLARIEEI